MIIFLISIVVVVASFGCFSLAYEVNGMNRLMIFTPLSLIEKHVELEGGNSLNFSVDNVTEQLDSYYKPKIEKYSSEYNLEYYFYNQLDHSYCWMDYCNALEVTVSANLSFNYKYKRTVYFAIKENL